MQPNFVEIHNGRATMIVPVHRIESIGFRSDKGDGHRAVVTLIGDNGREWLMSEDAAYRLTVERIDVPAGTATIDGGFPVLWIERNGDGSAVAYCWHQESEHVQAHDIAVDDLLYTRADPAIERAADQAVTDRGKFANEGW